MSPILVERPWGGRRLEALGKDLPTGLTIGESWEVADLPPHVAPTVDDPRSRVADGPFAGETLSDLIAQSGDDLLGPIAPTDEGRFPLLVKLLDARENLSVQVHPDATYVDRHPEAFLKTESWYVVASEPGSELMLDVRPGVTLDEIGRAMATPRVVPLLSSVSAQIGSFHHVPAGLLHAIGAGVLVAEVQTPSDTTFRVYDWSVEYGRAPRPLHPRESLESLRLHLPEAFSLPAAATGGVRTLISNPHYWIREHRGPEIRLSDAPGPRVMMVVAGSAVIGRSESATGSTVVIPAAGIDVDLAGRDGSVVLEIGLGFSPR